MFSADLICLIALQDWTTGRKHAAIWCICHFHPGAPDGLQSWRGKIIVAANLPVCNNLNHCPNKYLPISVITDAELVTYIPKMLKWYSIKCFVVALVFRKPNFYLLCKKLRDGVLIEVTWRETIESALWHYFLQNIDYQNIPSQLKGCRARIQHSLLTPRNFVRKKGLAKQW